MGCKACKADTKVVTPVNVADIKKTGIDYNSADPFNMVSKNKECIRV